MMSDYQQLPPLLIRLIERTTDSGAVRVRVSVARAYLTSRAFLRNASAIFDPLQFNHAAHFELSDPVSILLPNDEPMSDFFLGQLQRITRDWMPELSNPHELERRLTVVSDSRNGPGDVRHVVLMLEGV